MTALVIAASAGGIPVPTGDALTYILTGSGGMGAAILSAWVLIRSLKEQVQNMQDKQSVHEAELAALRVSHTALESSIAPKIAAMQADIHDLKQIAIDNIPRILVAIESNRRPHTETKE